MHYYGRFSIFRSWNFSLIQLEKQMATLVLNDEILRNIIAIRQQFMMEHNEGMRQNYQINKSFRTSLAFFLSLSLICEHCCSSIKIWMNSKSMLLHIFKWETKFIKRNEFAEQNIRLRRLDAMFWLLFFIVYLWRGVHISLENSSATRQLASHAILHFCVFTSICSDFSSVFCSVSLFVW